MIRDNYPTSLGNPVKGSWFMWAYQKISNNLELPKLKITYKVSEKAKSKFEEALKIRRENLENDKNKITNKSKIVNLILIRLYISSN